MKKIIAAVVLSFSFCFSVMAGPLFGAWQVSNSGNSMLSVVENDGGERFGLHVWDDGSIHLTYSSSSVKGEVGDVVATNNLVITVNGQRVKFTASMFNNGFIMMKPATQKGLDFVGDQLWSNTKVKFTLEDGQWVWFSAIGVQKAWKHMHSVKQAI